MKKFFHWSVLLFAFTIPFPPLFNSRILLFVVLFAVVVARKENNFLKRLATSWDIILYLLVIVTGLLFSSDKNTGYRVIETNLSFLAIPIIFNCYHRLKEKQLFSFFYAFTCGLLVSCLVCLVYALIAFSKTGDANVFFFYQFTDAIGSHPTYLAYYIIFAITFGLYLLHYQKSEFSSPLTILALCFLFVMLMLTGGKTTFISMLLIFSFFILRFLVEEKTHSKRIAFAVVFFMMAAMFVINSIDIGNRDTLLNDSWERFVLWESAIKASPDLIFGVGTGDYRLLNEYYISHHLTQFAENSFNAHNQFIQILYTNGIFGFAAVLIMMSRPLYLSIVNQNILGVLVLFPFLIYGMTEVFLGRYQGVVFFALLHQCFYAYYQGNTRHFSLKDI